jgi:hypothetical protein
MLLLIDNYDSFTYNLVHYLGELGAEARVVRNDEITAAQAFALKPRAIVISPGPRTPNDAGICLELVSPPRPESCRGPRDRPTVSSSPMKTAAADKASLRCRTRSA